MRYIKDGIVISRGQAVEIDGMVVINAPEKMLLDNGWEVYNEPAPEPHVETEEEKEMRYKSRIVELIRERYTIDDELALNRQREDKRTEWVAYDTFCEECKTKAREEVWD